MKIQALTVALVLALPLAAQAQPLPQRHIPSSVLMELRQLESQFDSALLHDCASETCVSKGCAYRDHAVVDMPRDSSLPGLPSAEGPGSVPPQEYLTQAQCDFAYEKAIPAKDIQALGRRLEQRLSKGWLRVTVGRQVLEPVSPSLSEAPAKAEASPAPAPAPAGPWETSVAFRELWVSLLPHFWWMVGLALGTFAILLVIWASRRLGRESLEEKAMLAQLAAGTLEKKEDDEAPGEPEAIEPPPPVPALRSGEDADQAAYVAEQQRLWIDRIAEAELAKDESTVVELLRHWLKTGEFELLAKAISVFGDRLTVAFSSDGNLVARKVEFAEYLRNLDGRPLPSDAEFFRSLNHGAISSSLLSHSDASIYLSLREDFGSTGVAHLVTSLPARHGALFFAMVPVDFQHEVARLLPRELRLQVAGQLMLSNRISKEEQDHLFEALDAARSNRPLPPAPKVQPHGIHDRGREFDAAAALSILFSHLAPEDRAALVKTVLERSNGAMPAWCQEILHPDMLLKLPAETQRDLLLDVDVKALAAWISLQLPAWQHGFIGGLAPSLQNAVRANSTFPSRVDQLRLAQRGHRELVYAMAKAVNHGNLSHAALLA